MLKRCKQCKKELSYSFFHVKGKTKSGAIKRDTICKNCKSTVHQRLVDLYGESGTKECSSCKQILPWESFSYRVQDGARYLRSKCKNCSLTAWTRWADLHPEYKNKKLESDRDCHQKYKKFHRHGITREQYLLMVEAQCGVCAICKKPPTDGQNLAIDHNHKTDEVRGLLCKQCNRALGLFGDSINSVENALNYLKDRGSYG
jgi:hypothetical protein